MTCANYSGSSTQSSRRLQASNAAQQESERTLEPDRGGVALAHACVAVSIGRPTRMIPNPPRFAILATRRLSLRKRPFRIRRRRSRAQRRPYPRYDIFAALSVVFVGGCRWSPMVLRIALIMAVVMRAKALDHLRAKRRLGRIGGQHHGEGPCHRNCVVAHRVLLLWL